MQEGELGGSVFMVKRNSCDQAPARKLVTCDYVSKCRRDRRASDIEKNLRREIVFVITEYRVTDMLLVQAR